MRQRERFRPPASFGLSVEVRPAVGQSLAARRTRLEPGDLAERLEVSRQSVNAIETGRYDPSLPLAFRIAKLFGMRIEEVFASPSRSFDLD